MDSVMAKINEAMKHFKLSLEEGKRAHDILDGGPASFYLEKLDLYVNALFTKYAPFHEGDRVALTENIRTEGTHWHSSRHFLAVGSKGTVHGVDYSKHGYFLADVVFDDESWINQEGKQIPVDVDHRHTFCIKEHELQRIETGKQVIEA